MVLTPLGRIPMSRLPPSVFSPIPNFASNHRPTHPDYIPQVDESTPLPQVPSFGIALPTRRTSFDRCIVVQACACPPLVNGSDVGGSRGGTHGEDPFLLSGDEDELFRVCQRAIRNDERHRSVTRPWYKNRVSIHCCNMADLTQQNRLPRLKIVFNHH